MDAAGCMLQAGHALPRRPEKVQRALVGWTGTPCREPGAQGHSLYWFGVLVAMPIQGRWLCWRAERRASFKCTHFNRTSLLSGVERSTLHKHSRLRTGPPSQQRTHAQLSPNKLRLSLRTHFLAPKQTCWELPARQGVPEVGAAVHDGFAFWGAQDRLRCACTP